MEELTIAIEELEREKYELHSAISKPFDYGRSPGDEEYIQIGGLVNQLRVVEGKIGFAKDILRDIKINLAVCTDERMCTNCYSGKGECLNA